MEYLKIVDEVDLKELEKFGLIKHGSKYVILSEQKAMPFDMLRVGIVEKWRG